MSELPGDQAEVKIDAENPWLGLLPFSEAHRFHFFGRDEEISEMVQRISENTLTVVFGQSGLGKTSLLAAGVLPRLRQRGLAPVLLRLRYDPDAPPLIDQTRDAIYGALAGGAPQPEERGGSLWEILHRLPILVPPGLPQPVLVFDQFEEIYTLGRQDSEREAASEIWLEEIADLIQNRPPKGLVARFEQDRDLPRQYEFGPCPVHFVFGLREDYLSYLEEWKRTMPLLVHNRMSLHALNGTQALEAVLGPASLGESPLVSRQVAAAIVRKVARVEPDVPLPEIRAVPPLLSLLCEQLNLARIADGKAQIDAEMVAGRSDDILHRFYEDSFAIFSEDERRHIRCFVEDKLVTRGGHRQPIARDDAEAELGEAGVSGVKEAIDELVRRRLLTADEEGHVQRVEITHDVLLPLVLRSRKKRREREERESNERARSEQELRERQEREEMVQRLAEESKRSRRLRAVITAIAVLAAVATLGLVLAGISNARYKRTLNHINSIEGTLWFERAEVSENARNYPASLLYAARAIGYEGFGGPPDIDDDDVYFLRKDYETEDFKRARDWLIRQPAYLPIWAETLAGPISGVDFDPSARYLAVCTRRGQAVVWDLSNGSCQTLLEAGSAGILNDLVFEPSGEKIAVAGEAGVKVLAKTNGRVLDEKGGASTALAYNGAGDLLIRAGSDGSFVIADAIGPSGPPSAKLKPALRLSVSADTLAAACQDEGVKVVYLRASGFANCWPPVELKNLGTTPKPFLMPPLKVTAVALTPDAKQVAIGTEDGMISIWRIDNVRQVSTILGERRHGGAVSDLVFRGDGQQLASASADGTVKIWEQVEKEREVEDDEDSEKRNDQILDLKVTLGGHSGGVARIRYAPSGELLASAGIDGRVLIWDVTGKPRPELDYFKYVDAGWFTFDRKRQLAAQKVGSGVLNLPPESIIAHWRQSPDEVLALLLAKGEWNALVPASITAGKKGEKTRATLIPLLEDDARRSANAKDWLRFDLRIHQLQALSVGPPDDLNDFRKRREEFGREGHNFTNGESMDLIWCPPGTFMMGSPGEPNKEPGRAPIGEAQCEVTLTQGFWMANCEVTQAQWFALMETFPSFFKDHRDRIRAQPVDSIDWFNAMEFCRRLTSRERMRGMIPPGWEYSLPTEAEWEYACRAGTDTPYNFGPDPGVLSSYANFRDRSFSKGNLSNEPEKGAALDQDDGYIGTAPVKSYKPNAWGLYDMHGNVTEWCLDYRDPSDARHLPEEGAPHKATDPFTGPSPGNDQIEKRMDRLLRGGCYADEAKNCRSARGFASRALTTKKEYGMRVVLVPVRNLAPTP